ncbi:MAG: inositol monophosphatase [Chloroflexi bacterium]|nr:inositol monophosphatase [Chloroflexota bacterium]
MDYSLMLETAMRAAREAGQIALASIGKPEFQQWKGPRDLLVGSVLPIQQRIIDIIHAAHPDHAILAEESSENGLSVGDSNEADPLWIIDPIDGSLNYYQGIPHFAISIAFRSEGVYQVGVVYNPCTNEMFSALHNRFARLNDQPIVIQQVSEGESAYDQAIVGTDLPGGMQARQVSLNIATLLATQAITINVMGSPALGLCYVAAGRYHAYYHTALELWDVAAASVVLSESGGILTDILGGSWLHSTGGYIATNGVIHGWMVRATKAVLEPSRQ